MAKTTRTKKTEVQAPEVSVDATKFEGMRSIYLVLENFKNIEKKVINIGGRSMVFLGPNGTGKSSIIQAMMGSMNSKLLPSQPVGTGKQHAVISHKIAGNVAGEYKEYTITIHFDERTGSGNLTLTDENGETVKSPATKIKDIIGNVSFDVTKWLNEKKEDKLKTLKRLTGKGVEIDTINMEIKDLKTQRTAKNNRADELEGALKNHGMTQEEIAKYSEPVPLEPIQAEMEQVSALQTQYDGVVTKIDGFIKDIEVSQRKLSDLATEDERINTEIHRLQNLLAQNSIAKQAESENIARLQQNVLRGEEWKRQAVRPTIEAVSARMSAAVAHNEKNKQIGMLAEYHKEMVRLKMESDGMKTDIDAKEAQRAQIIATSQLPVPGLSFTEDEIFLDGLPLEEGQQNTAKLWDIGVEVAMALHPTYRGIFLHDGSLFDKEHLSAIVHKIESRGYFAIIEMVDFEGTELEVKFTEEIIK